MNIHSYTVCHYGKAYLPYALKSIYEFVDQLHVFYTSHPSHGTRTDIECPETKEQLFNAAMSIDIHNKINWYETEQFFDEGPQRDFAVQTCINAGADIILVVDCDEIWPSKTLESALEIVINADGARNWLVNMIHFWRSFNWVCYDQGWPVRIIDTRHNDGIQYLDNERVGRVFHFGYAVSDEIMSYKWKIHGHKGELRKDWFETKWNKWPPPNDCHPTNEKGFWNPVEFDKRELPNFMKIHPYYYYEERIE